MIDGEGNAYYAERQYCCPRDDEKLFWFWDNNQYDLLVELTTKAIGEIPIRYGHPQHFLTPRHSLASSSNIPLSPLEEHPPPLSVEVMSYENLPVEILELRYGDVSYNETREEEGQESVFPNLSNATSEVRAEIETPPATVTWSHQINLAVEEGVTLKVNE